MRIVRTISEMQNISRALKRRGKTIGLVPTMGALHEGHLSLVRQSRRDNDITVVSIFVNPIQFGPQEDLARYPRPFSRDAALCKKEKVDLIFHPSAEQMYPPGFRTSVEVAGLGKVLCGVSRPGHFRGVTTVVTKLFHAVGPDNAYFGQKDCQQAVIVGRMIADLDFPLKIRVVPTVREGDGLAMSSRNIYLDARQRRGSLALSRSLKLARGLVRSGTRDSATIVRRMKSLINSKKGAKIDYVSVVDLQELKPVTTVKAGCLIALAVRFGKTRLIDNLILKKGDTSDFKNGKCPHDPEL